MSLWPSWVHDLEVQKEMGTQARNRNHKLKAWKPPFCIKKHSSDNYTLYFKENWVTGTDLGTGGRLWLGPGLWDRSGTRELPGQPGGPFWAGGDRAVWELSPGWVRVRCAAAGAAPLGATATAGLRQGGEEHASPGHASRGDGGKEGRNDVQLSSSHLGCICPCLQKHILGIQADENDSIYATWVVPAEAQVLFSVLMGCAFLWVSK